MVERKEALVLLGVVMLAILVLGAYLLTMGERKFTVTLGGCEPTVSNSRVTCTQGHVYGYFLFPREIVSLSKTYDPSTGTITVVTEETEPVGCYRAFEINWQGVDVQRVMFVIELNGKQVGRTVLDVNACVFYGRQS